MDDTPSTDRGGPRGDAPGYILQGSVAVAVLKLSWPFWISATLEDFYSLVDLFWVGRLGPSAVAALALCGTLMGMAFTVAVGIATGALAVVARHVGEGRPEAAWAATWQSLYLGIGLGLLSTALGVPLAGPLLELLQAEGEVLRQGTVYLQIIALGAVPLFVSFSLTSALRGAGDAVTPMIALLAGNLMNLVLDPVLIFGWFGAPRLGVAGAAAATLASQGTAFAYVLWVLVRGRAPLRLSLRHARPDPALILRIARIGIFGSMQMLVRNASALAVVAIVSPFGQAALAAYGVGMRLMMVVLMPGFGLGNAAATVAGQNLGAGARDRAVLAGWIASFLYLAITSVFAAVLLAGAPGIVAVFSDDPGVVDAGASLLFWLALSFFFLPFGLAPARAMAGAGDTFTPLWTTTISLLLLQVPAAWGFSQAFGLQGLWSSFLVAHAANALLTVVWYHRGKWASRKP
jgi:putative MATE family efflux protein